LYSQPKNPFFQTSAQPSPPPGRRRRLVAEERAEVEEVLLRRGALGELHPPPLGDELRRVH